MTITKPCCRCEPGGVLAFFGLLQVAEQRVENAGEARRRRARVGSIGMRAGRDRCGGLMMLHAIPYNITEGDKLQTARLAINLWVRVITFPNLENCVHEPIDVTRLSIGLPKSRCKKNHCEAIFCFCGLTHPVHCQVRIDSAPGQSSSHPFDCRIKWRLC